MEAKFKVNCKFQYFENNMYTTVRHALDLLANILFIHMGHIRFGKIQDMFSFYYLFS